jgi:hypothetical protein
MADQPRGKDARVIDHEQIARAEIVDQIPELPMLDASPLAMKHQQA